MLITRIFTLLLLLLMISSCDKSNENLTGLNNLELRKKWRECAYIRSPSSSEQHICGNYERECNDRKDQGNLSCY
ncbi:hypothetical protein SAMN02745753_02061 [Marinomonas polaris DSM 16579]|jgi:hypothetical protein|uniref:Lipoprotein n=1 Tax=Marinomonas polaris DSM 16579 TaxID=1122206 RepID=A0A1M5C1W9_9GAMM|nr:hypothetical protein SAMN02745753_02061 [Marinomonas polaris DSM 16579]